MKLIITTQQLVLLLLFLMFFYINSAMNSAMDSAIDESNDIHNKKVSFREEPTVVIYEQPPPIKEPKRYYESRYTQPRPRINIPTRGEPSNYQQVGILQNTTNNEDVKPLYGRQTYPGSNQWNYFTSLDSHLATKIPVTLGTTDCTDERGCTELQKNQTITILQNDYNVTLYNTYAPRYIPY